MRPALLDDPFAARQIDAAMSDLSEALAPEDQNWLRAQLALLLEEEPSLREALAGARPHDVDQSGERVVGPLEDEGQTGTDPR